ncbi:hypothetical protein Q5741_04750 [Paenibacillus sp. JX-17]|uniref:Uncharacterized protein n=1 Tax=Paenibacillus lacisoli TaxID=3064525 RepID=A0ABT9C8Y9_9BACL|nr:hypothetical protein [Paenibacillus sp. JX-17]MDO7905721.1 hypothetical protein [Paenibacillus sp. JX-17]
MLTVNVSKQKMITLHAKELFFLAGVLGSNRLLGIEDPFSGYLAEELAEEWSRVRESLLQKGYLKQVEQGKELAMLPTVFSRVAIAGLSDKACWIRYDREGKSFEGYLHCTNERVVEVSRLEGQDDCYRLCELGNVEDACSALIGRMGWMEQSPSDAPALMFSKKSFLEMYQHRDSLAFGELSERLVLASGDEEGALALTSALKNNVSSGELQLLSWNGSEWETQRAAFVIGHAMNWLFRMSARGQDDWLVAALATRTQIEDLLLNWLRQPSE